MLNTLREGVFQWYSFIGALSADLTPHIELLTQQIGIPMVTALLLGLLGAAAPCQLTQSVGMLAVLGRRPGSSRWRDALAYVSGKALVYTALGLVALATGTGFAATSIPLFVWVRKALGPLMILIGFAMAGGIRLRWAPGFRLATALRARIDWQRRGTPLLLGAAFGFAFCPTLFVLFFGLLIPLALARPDGVVYPALFALGTTLPLMTVLGLLTLRRGGTARGYARQVGRGQQIAAVLTGLTVIGVGFHDTFVYWLL